MAIVLRGRCQRIRRRSQARRHLRRLRNRYRQTLHLCRLWEVSLAIGP